MPYRIETNCVQAGYSPAAGEPRVVPIVQSTTFKYDTSEQMADLFDLNASGFFYTRLGNPTTDAVEKKIAALEGGVGAMLTASGQAASMLSILNIAKAGDHIVASTALYGGSLNLVGTTLPRLGIECTFVKPSASAEELSAAFRPSTKAVFAETLTNPSLAVLDIEAFAAAAHAHGVPLIVDNTFATPIQCRPMQFGADIVVHSTSKYMDGHATVLGGAIVDGGTFDWKNGKFPGLSEPDESYHGTVFADKFGPAAYIAKARLTLMRDMGPAMAPMAAFLLNLGLETLALRVERHCENALKVAQYLSAHEKVAWVNYPSLPSDPQYSLAQKYMPKGTSGVVSFGVKGGREAAMRFMESLRLAAVVTHVADARTCALHPASTTHRQMTDEQLLASGTSPDLIRFSVGIENVQDILEDIEQALNA